MADTANPYHSPAHEGSRRDFLELVTWSATAIGAAALVWPLVDNMNPSADALALSSTEVDLANIPEGMAITAGGAASRSSYVIVRRPRFRRRPRCRWASCATRSRTPPGLEKPEWLIVIGICTHLGCVPLGNKPPSSAGASVAGSAPAMARTTILPAGSGRARRR